MKLCVVLLVLGVSHAQNADDCVCNKVSDCKTCSGPCTTQNFDVGGELEFCHEQCTEVGSSFSEGCTDTDTNTNTDTDTDTDTDTEIPAIPDIPSTDSPSPPSPPPSPGQSEFGFDFDDDDDMTGGTTSDGTSTGADTTTTTTTTGTTGTFTEGTTTGSTTDGDPCFSREDTTVCRLNDEVVAPSAAFEQCFGTAAASQAERVPMKDLVAGDLVLSSPTAATRVLVQQHAEASARKATMLLLKHETGMLILTPDHVLKIDGAFQPAREAAVGGVLEPTSRITKVSTVTRGIISPITLSGQLLAAGSSGAPVVATVWPEWIAGLMLGRMLYPLPYSFASAAAYLFPASVQQFYNEQLEALFTQATPSLKGLKAAVPTPIALAILAGFDAACVGAFAAWACGLKGLVAVLAVALAATARRAAKKA